MSGGLDREWVVDRECWVSRSIVWVILDQNYFGCLVSWSRVDVGLDRERSIDRDVFSARIFSFPINSSCIGVHFHFRHSLLTPNPKIYYFSLFFIHSSPSFLLLIHSPFLHSSPSSLNRRFLFESGLLVFNGFPLFCKLCNYLIVNHHLES